MGYDPKTAVQITKVGENKEGWTRVEGVVLGKRVSVDMATADINKPSRGDGEQLIKRSLVGTALSETERE